MIFVFKFIILNLTALDYDLILSNIGFTNNFSFQDSIIVKGGWASIADINMFLNWESSWFDINID